jgi:uncharacterized iron-regulated protein
MKTLISALFILLFIASNTFAGDPKCDSLIQVLKDLNKKSNAYANKFKAQIDARADETDRIVRGSAGDTATAQNLIARYEKDTAFFQKCLDTANILKAQIKANEIMLAKNCDQIISVKQFTAIQGQNTNTDIYLEGFIDFAEEMKKDCVKELKHTKKEYAGLIEFYRKN